MKRRITFTTPDWFVGKARSGSMPRRSVALSLSLLVFITISIFCVLSFTETVVQPLVYAHLGACNDLSLTDEEPEDLEEWQKERYLSEKFQYELETPQAKCTGELGVKIHNQLQEALHTLQHPTTCNGRFLIWKLGKGGFGQEVRKLAYQLAIAYAENRTLVLDTSTPWKYTDKDICPEQSLYCYFKPITQCTMDDVQRVLQNRGETSIPVWSEDTPNEPVVFGHYNTSKWRFFTPTEYGTLLSLEWFRSELLYYVLQPNEYTQTIVREEKEKLGLPTELDRSLPYIAIHVRGGDKHTEYKLHPFQEYLNKAKWFKTLYGVRNIFLVSDDAEVISQALEQPEGFNIIWSMNDRDKGGSQEISEVGHQVMVKVLKDIFIASQCQFWVGTLSSNFGDTIWELMVARNAGTVPPYVSLDIPWTTHNQPNVFI